MGWSSNEEALGKKFRSLSGDENHSRGFPAIFSQLHFMKPGGPFVLNMKEKPGEINFLHEICSHPDYREK